MLSVISREQVVEMLLGEDSFFPAVNVSSALLPCLSTLLELCMHGEACRKQTVTVTSGIMTER